MPKKTIADPRYDEALKKAQRKGARVQAVMPLLVAAHEAGDARATYALATWYLHGVGVPKDLRHSILLLKQASKLENPDAMYDLAICYEKGEGIAKNLNKAFELYLKAAQQGDKLALYEVGRCYYHGIGVRKDRRKARVWLDRAEKLGVTS